MRPTTAWLLPVLLAAHVLPVFGQEYPAKTVRIVVPFSPGAATDTLGRTIAQRFTEAWGQQVIVENRAGGGGGSVGSGTVAKAPPDGYTLLIANYSSHVGAPHLYKKIPYDAIRDFAPISLVAHVPQMLAIHPSLPVRDVKSLIALARKRPGQLSYSSSGIGTSLHLAGELFGAMAQVNILHIPYKGASIAVIDLAGGQVQMSFSAVSTVLPFVKQGRVHPLAVTTLKRFSVIPDVPTVAEAGLPGYEMVNWVGLVAPAQTPPDIVAKLNAEISVWASQRENQQRQAALGFALEPGSPADFADLLARSHAVAGKLVKSLGIQPE